MKKICAILMVGSFLFLLSCATTQTTTDPRKGGLFSYNRKAYEKRLDDRRAKKGDLESKQTIEQQKKEQLEGQVALKQSERNALRKKIASLDSDISKIEKQIASAKIQNDKQKHAQWKINMKLKALKKKLAAAKSSASPDTKAKKKEIERLEKELDRLLEEAEELSKL